MSAARWEGAAATEHSHSHIPQSIYNDFVKERLLQSTATAAATEHSESSSSAIDALPALEPQAAAPAATGQATATEHGHAAAAATQHSRPTIPGMDPMIRLQKCLAPAALRIKTHHPRTPDVGTGVLVSVPSYRAGTEDPLEMVDYYGEYLGHGQSKTAFELKFMTSPIVSPSARFHGKVLKISRAKDMEPAVFKVTSAMGVTTSILYDGVGVDAESGCQFHCWITDRTIPLDEVCRYTDAIKSKCSLAAFCCILRAAHQGLRVSDCAFFNFGVRLSDGYYRASRRHHRRWQPRHPA